MSKNMVYLMGFYNPIGLFQIEDLPGLPSASLSGLENPAGLFILFK